MNMAVKEADRRPLRHGTLSCADLATASAICNRISRILGLSDREGLLRDIEIVQAKAPINLEGLAAAHDKLFVEELMKIIDHADREIGELEPGYFSVFMQDGEHDSLF